MPSGKTHAVMTVTATAGITVGMALAGFPPQDIQNATMGCMTGIILSPDLDVDGGFLGHGIMQKYFGVIFGTIWKAFWLPYAWFFPHRSEGSHFPVISTLGRVFYVYGMYFCICVDFNINPWVPDVRTAFYLISGLVVSDTLHYFADKIATALKRRRHASLPIPVQKMLERRRGYARFQRSSPQKAPSVRRYSAANIRRPRGRI